MDAQTALAVGFGAAALVLLVLQLLFALEATTLLADLREGHAETARSLDALHKALTKGFKMTEARLRRVERRCGPGGPQTTDAARATPQGSQERCNRVSTINEDQSSPQAVDDINCDALAWSGSEGEGRPPTPDQYNKSPSPSGPNMRVSCGGRRQGRSTSSQLSSPARLEGAEASMAPPTAKTRRHASTPSTPVAWPWGVLTQTRSDTGHLSSCSFFYAEVVDRMRRNETRNVDRQSRASRGPTASG